MASLVAVFGLQLATVREELFGPLVEVPERSAWLSNQRSLIQSSGHYQTLHLTSIYCLDMRATRVEHRVDHIQSYLKFLLHKKLNILIL